MVGAEYKLQVTLVYSSQEADETIYIELTAAIE